MKLQCFIMLALHGICWGQKRVFKATKIMIDKIQYNNNIGTSTTSNLWGCYFECFRELRCLTFFYNSVTKTCVLHSKTFKYTPPEITEAGWTTYVFEDVQSRCSFEPNGFFLYRALDMCYNFNPPTVINYDGYMRPKCASYNGALLKIDSAEKQAYVSNILEGRPTDRVAIQGHSFNPGDVWTYDDGTPLVYSNWRVNPAAPLPGQWYAQIFLYDEWTEQNNYRDTLNCIFLCEIPR